jgi:hypothetical protein
MSSLLQEKGGAYFDLVINQLQFFHYADKVDKAICNQTQRLQKDRWALKSVAA